jgi:hypothetical protein
VLERGAEAVDRRGGFCAERLGLRGSSAQGCRPWQIYRWRHDLRSIAAEFAEVTVTPGQCKSQCLFAPVLTEDGSSPCAQGGP